MTAPTVALVLGASGGLARAIIAELMADAGIETVVAVSRNPLPQQLVEAQSNRKVQWITSNYNETEMAAVVEQLQPYSGRISRVCICHGILHSSVEDSVANSVEGSVDSLVKSPAMASGQQGTLWPEKRLEDIGADALHQVFQANAVVPVLWLKLLHRVLKGPQRCVVAALSARVGSIGDNHLGGWYAYRSSKAALNMLMRTVAIEYSRRIKNVKLISFHPGTTDTALSKPFQSAVPSDKLFTPQFVAERLCRIMDTAEIDGELSYLDWDNKSIPW